MTVIIKKVKQFQEIKALQLILHDYYNRLKKSRPSLVLKINESSTKYENVYL